MKYLYLVFLSSVVNFAYAQTDSLVFKNGNYMVGEAKSMDKGVLKVETDYSDSDFTIEWNGIDLIFTETKYLITLSDGSRYNGSLESISADQINLVLLDSTKVSVAHNDVVYLQSVDDGFWDQLYASIDVGFSVTKANNLRQLTVRSNLGYVAKRWSADATFNTLNSTQNDTDPIDRTDGVATFNYFLPSDWFVNFSMNFLSNSEQRLKLRINSMTGFGKYLIHSNKSYWSVGVGISRNNESYFSDDIPSKSSWEGYLGSELNLFDIGDLNLKTHGIAYPSFTESGRWRVDFGLDFKYDLPFDFYVKTGFSLNFDNRPAPDAAETDYVWQTGVGWEW